MVTSEAWNACAVPSNCPIRVGGAPRLAFAAVMASTAWLRDAPGARLNDSVTDGKTPWWLMVSGSTLRVTCATADSGTCPPVALVT